MCKVSCVTGYQDGIVCQSDRSNTQILRTDPYVLMPQCQELLKGFLCETEHMLDCEIAHCLLKCFVCSNLEW